MTSPLAILLLTLLVLYTFAAIGYINSDMKEKK